MREITTAMIEAKNAAETSRPWALLFELTVNANSKAYFTSHPETVTWNGTTYRTAPMRVSEEEIASDGSLPQFFVDVSNIGGEAFRFAKHNDLSQNEVTMRLINLSATSSGDDVRLRMKIHNTAFTNEVARFNLGITFNNDAEGPVRRFDRSSFPSIPFGFRNYAIIPT